MDATNVEPRSRISWEVATAVGNGLEDFTNVSSVDDMEVKVVESRVKFGTDKFVFTTKLELFFLVLDTFVYVTDYQ